MGFDDNSIRGTLLSRKLISKLMKSMNDHLQLILTRLQARDQQSDQQRKSISSQISSSIPEIKSSDKLPSEIVSGKSTHSQEKYLDVRIFQAYVSFLTSIASVSSSKFHIPGETKEVQALRRKAILNGILVFTQYLQHQVKGREPPLLENKQLEGVKEAFSKLQHDVLECLDLSDFRLHLYSIYTILRHKLESGKQKGEG